MTALIAYWSGLVAASLFAAAALWRARDADGPGARLFAGALAATAVWAAVAVLANPLSFLAEAARNLFWLAWLRHLARAGLQDRRGRALRLVWAALAGVIGMQALLAAVALAADLEPIARAALAATGLVLGMTVAAGALVFLHNAYGFAAPQARGAVRLPALGLALLWAYDLNLYTTAHLAPVWPAEVGAMRTAVAALALPLFALTPRAGVAARLSLSRAATFQSLSLGLIVAYLALMMALASAGQAFSPGLWRGAQLALLAALSAAALLAVASAAVRSRLKLLAAKHLFQHRYDYRAEWLRFTAVLAGQEGLPVPARVARAMAGIMDAPGALLLLPAADGLLVAGGVWNARDVPRAGVEGRDWAAALERAGRVVDLDALRAGRVDPRVPELPVPAALIADARWRAAVPLIHERLEGVVLLARPPVDRPLDWEDFDLLLTAARGAASALAEARGQAVLAEAARFDEFNRRFAFILHDIKNMVSGLELVARNAERHGDNPAFRADMAATLGDATGRMKALLARLASAEPAAPATPEPVPLVPLARALLARLPEAEDVRVAAEGQPVALADAAGLEQALEHLVRNAVEAGGPVLVELRADVEGATIQVIDRGAGMTPEFVAHELFRPFSSTKAGGFGVGAHEARALVEGMGGTLAVDSRPEEGTRFTIMLPVSVEANTSNPLVSSPSAACKAGAQDELGPTGQVETRSTSSNDGASLDFARDERVSGRKRAA